MSDGKLRWANHGRLAAYSYMPSLTFNDQFTRIMAEIPETAPRDENHFLQTSTDVRQIQYGARSIRYETGGGRLRNLHSCPGAAGSEGGCGQVAKTGRGQPPKRLAL